MCVCTRVTEEREKERKGGKKRGGFESTEACGLLIATSQKSCFALAQPREQALSPVVSKEHLQHQQHTAATAGPEQQTAVTFPSPLPTAGTTGSHLPGPETPGKGTRVFASSGWSLEASPGWDTCAYTGIHVYACTCVCTHNPLCRIHLHFRSHVYTDTRAYGCRAHS